MPNLLEEYERARKARWAADADLREAEYALVRALADTGSYHALKLQPRVVQHMIREHIVVPDGPPVSKPAKRAIVEPA